MVNATLQTYIKYNASVGTIFHPMKNTVIETTGYNCPRSWASVKDWQAESVWSGKYGAVNTQSGVWRKMIDQTVDINPSDRIPCGHDTQGTDVGQTDTLFRIDINGVTVHTHTFENQLNDIFIYQVGGKIPDATPTYLETLDKLDQWSSAQYIPNSGNKLNL